MTRFTQPASHTYVHVLSLWLAVISNLYWLVSSYALYLSTNPKLWDLILPGDLKEWDTEDTLIYDL
jgi:hypothetical protein